MVGFNQTKLARLAERLHKQGLVYKYKLRNIITYTAHPFLREYFRELLGVPSEKIHEVVRSKLAVGLDTRPENKPKTPEMLDKYESLIEHNVLSGHFQEAYDLFQNSMSGSAGREHLYHKVGDYGRIIRILSLFSEDSQPEHATSQLSIFDRGVLVNLWGLAADALGDLDTAELCFDLYIGLSKKDKNMGELSQALQNSACNAIARGAFTLAKKLLKESLENAESGDIYRRWASHSGLAATCHSLGEISEAQKNFAKTIEISGRLPYAISGIREAEHLFAIGNKNYAFQRTQANLTFCEQNEWPRDISLCHALLGLLNLPESIAEARNHLKEIRGWTNQSGEMECIIRAHILAAEIAYCSGDYPGAISEVTTGLNHAESCGYGKFTIDLLLLLAKINLAIPDFRTALSNARKALDRSEHKDCRYAWGQANALHLCGVCHRELNEPELAKKRLEAALKIRKKIQHPGAEETQKLIDEYFKQ